MAGMVAQNITGDCMPGLSKAESWARGHEGWYVSQGIPLNYCWDASRNHILNFHIEDLKEMKLRGNGGKFCVKS